MNKQLDLLNQANPLPHYVTVVEMSADGRRWGVSCARHGGAVVAIADDLSTPEEAHEAALLHTHEHIDPADILTPEQVDHARTWALSQDQLAILYAAANDRLDEDINGFFSPDDGKGPVRTYSAARVHTLYAARLLAPSEVVRGRRWLRLTYRSRALLDRLEQARRQGWIEIPSKDNGLGVTSKQRAAYPSLKAAG